MKAYEGNENYIFVSYAHADSGTVVPIIEVLQNAGFRVWFDLGIEAGTEWPAYIEDHLNRCSRVIAFISPSAVESFNCRTEINYALMKKKEMLVVYLEETELKYGLSLQLNSIQSLFRYRHQTAKTFYWELTEARILQCCKNLSGDGEFNIPDEHISSAWSGANDVLENTLNSGNREKIKASRSGNASVISTVGTIPSNDPSNHWPAGTYSQIIDVDKFTAIHFHCRFIKPVTESGNKNIGIMIFDGDDNLVYDNRVKLNFEKTHDRFSLCWIISESGGLKQKPGNYTAIFWADDSRIFEYTFRITSSSGIGFTENKTENKKVTDINQTVFGKKNDKTEISGQKSTPSEIEKIKDKLTYPKAARRYLYALIFAFIGSGILSSSYAYGFELIIGFALVAAAIWAYISLWVISSKHIIKHKIWSAVVMTVGFGYYGIALFILSLWTLINKNKWKIRIAQLERGL
ncbi:MAG: toll/interleukin-1 receptor domain-containing protein [Clostridia bacterium]|nr:toll/interleukin-1 receptor domain-containing protein [Clostridia bacterium]